MTAMKTTLGLSLAAGLAFAASQASAAVLFSSDLSTSAGFTDVSEADTSVTFGFDYSVMGISAAPSGGDTVGLRLGANIAGGAAATASVVTNTSFTGAYKVSFDAWANVNGPFPGGGGGSTEFIGGVVGHDGSTLGQNGASMIMTGDRGSSRDVRGYKGTSEQFIASGQYHIASNNHDGLWGIFGHDGGDGVEDLPGDVGAAAPAFQQANYAQQTGNLGAGSGGFEWHQFSALVDGVAGTVTWSIDGVDIITIDSNIGDAVAVEGRAGLTYSDLFSSVSDNADLSFGVFDNFVVEDIPEPASLALFGLGGLVALRRRK
ncbi:PEP-CTERM sorting domain-containing protein [Poriferisphaera sp. WC338]|uniref:PEP-CTERM sorting domain-containing protein n=1 Tax=Poriferisphaera sp. WC338 TaxID=3425129 RepID=UPI003D81B70A